MITLADCLEAAEAQVDAIAPGPEPAPDPNPVEAPRKKRGGGPKTEAGKQSSRWNAYQHGMRAKVLMPDDMAAAVAERKDDLLQEFGPDSPYEEWLLGEMALAGTRLERLAMLSIADLQRTIDRAELCWEKDRRIAAEDLGARLSKQPSRVKLALEASRQGADFLKERWEGLGAALKAKGGWNDDQRALAFDLLGVPPALRDGDDKVPPRSSLSKAALEFMAERAEAVERAKFEAAVSRTAEDEGFELDDEFEAAVVAPPAPARAFTSASKSPAPRNRRERRAQERRARQA
jgi:hypothetical protein